MCGGVHGAGGGGAAAAMMKSPQKPAAVGGGAAEARLPAMKQQAAEAPDQMTQILAEFSKYLQQKNVNIK